MLSKYLIGFLGVGTVAGGAVATTIALSSDQNQNVNKEKGDSREKPGPTEEQNPSQGQPHSDSSQSPED